MSTLASTTPTLRDSIVGTTTIDGDVVPAAELGGLLHALTPCCSASATASYDGTTCCRSCYAEVSPLFGGDVREQDVRRAAGREV